MSDEKTLKFFNRRLFIIGSLKLILFFLLLGRLIYLQIIKGGNYANQAKNNSLRKLIIPSKRGAIFDFQGKILAHTIDIYIVLINLSKINNIEKFIEKYITILKLNPEEQDLILQKYNLYKNHKPHSGKNIQIKGLSLQDFLIARYYILADNEQISFIKKNYRNYPYINSCAHIVGYINNHIKKYETAYFTEKINFHKGSTGIEFLENDTLNGQDKILEIKINAFGKKIEENITHEGKNGENFYSTIDVELQEFIYQTLANHDIGGVSVVVSKYQPQTSNVDIIALISHPNFDPHVFGDDLYQNQKTWEKLKNDPDRPLLNRAISGLYSPGSVFKLPVALSALQQKIITHDTKIFCGGGHMVGNRFYSCLGHHGLINISQALKYSCNTFFYILASKMNIDLLHNHCTYLGMGCTSNLKFNGEKKGIIPSKKWKLEKFSEPWRPGDSANLMIGQGYLLTTPLQLNSMVASIALEHKIKFSLLSSNKNRYEYDNEHKKNITNDYCIQQEDLIDKNNFQLIKKAMFGVVNEIGGTCHYKLGQKYKHLNICAKTGTTQIVSKKNCTNHSIFVGFMPIEKPKYMISIVGEYAGYGSQFSTPLAGLIFDFLYKNR